MRPTKFRGRRVDNGEWVEGDKVELYYPRRQVCIAREGTNQNWGNTEFVEVDPETVGEWTGLKDKNGREIWEGDIVEWDDDSNGQWWRVAVVEIDPDLRYRIIEHPRRPLSCPVGTIFEYGNFIYKDAENWLEVIGTIHDAKEGKE